MSKAARNAGSVNRLDALTAATAAYAKALNAPLGSKVITNGYYAEGDGGGNEYIVVLNGTGADDGGSFINMDNGLQMKALFPDGVFVNQFGAYMDGVGNDTPAFVSASNYAKKKIQDLAGDLDQNKSIVKLKSGIYRIESGTAGSVAVRRYSGVTFKGEGSGVTWIEHYGQGSAFKPEETGNFLASVRDEGYSLLDSGGQGEVGFHALRMIRGCAVEDVIIKFFNDNWGVNDTWTFELNNCLGVDARQHNINAGSGTGELFINGGRYDVSESHSIYFNSSAGELILNTGASQFSKKSGVRVDSVRTVILRDGFFEGNCIGSLSDYNIHLNGNGDSLSSCVVEMSVINDLGDTNRQGLGALFVDNFGSFYYRERWVRNGSKALPVLGSNIQSIDIVTNNSGSLSESLTPINGSDAKFARVSQKNRPNSFYGKDMNSGPSVDIPSRSTATFHGNIGTGVALGTYGGVPCSQGFGAGNTQHLNPYAGDVLLGQSNAAVIEFTNAFRGTFVHSQQLTSSNITPSDEAGSVGVSTASGARGVTLSNITPRNGREITIFKNSSDTNSFTISSGTGGLINGQSSVSSTSPYKCYTLIANGADWVIKSETS